MMSSLLLENKEHKKERFQLKVLFVLENKKQNGHFREQMSEMMNTNFKRTKKGTHAQFNAYIEKK